MSSADSPTASEPKAVPDRVAIETPQERVRVGDVVDCWMEATPRGIERWYTVQINGSRYRRPASEVGDPNDDL